jgi:DNA helicase-2/ATP-dependent DNA helicase PcrA
MLSDDSTFTVLEVIKSAVASNVIELDRRWAPFVDGGGGDSEEFEYGKATQAFGACPARELWAYQRYILEESPFSTQHGIKGAEFERVITILDDGQSSHNQYSYDKLLELAPLSETDQKNIAAGVDSVLGRTRRLFYVSCSRAERDLAVLLFTDDPSKASQATKILQIFSAKDIRVLNGG